MNNITHIQGDVPLVVVTDTAEIDEVLKSGKPVKGNVIKHGETGNRHVLTLAGPETRLVEREGTLYLVVGDHGCVDHETHQDHQLKVDTGSVKPKVYRLAPVVERDPLDDAIREQRD